MDESIRIRSGSLNGRTEMPKLKPPEIVNGKKVGAEVGFQEEEKALYIGTANGNERLCGAGDIPALYEEIDRLKAQVEEIKARLEMSSE